jgi:hypothetical protein
MAAADGESMRRKDELRGWWMDIAGEEADKAVSKADEYGSYDLVLLGRVMADMTGFPVQPGESDEETYAELGIMFYVLGKLARWTGAIVEGRRVSDDTLQDIATYTRMVQRVRAVGGWPFGTDNAPNYSGGQPKETLTQYVLNAEHLSNDALMLEAVRRGLVDGAWVARPDCKAEHTSVSGVRSTERGHEHYIENGSV